MTIKWLGHSCFLFTSESGVRILTDPCNPEIGYDIGSVEADIVTSSHDHFDHNNIAAAGEKAVVITEAGRHQVKGITIEGFPSFHDDACGALRGPNVMFLFEIDGVRLLHAGDLGQLPDEATIKAIGRVDVLLTPVGGNYTIDYQGARDLANILKPKVVIPMHYYTDVVKAELDDVNEFLDHASGCAIHRMRQSEASITPESLGSDRIIVLDYRA